jgi:hypothetical protein
VYLSSLFGSCAAGPGSGGLRPPRGRCPRPPARSHARARNLPRRRRLRTLDQRPLRPRGAPGRRRACAARSTSRASRSGRRHGTHAPRWLTCGARRSRNEFAHPNAVAIRRFGVRWAVAEVGLAWGEPLEDAQVLLEPRLGLLEVARLHRRRSRANLAVALRRIGLASKPEYRRDPVAFRQIVVAYVGGSAPDFSGDGRRAAPAGPLSRAAGARSSVTRTWRGSWNAAAP